MDQTVCTVIIRGSREEYDKNITYCRDWTVEELKKKIECVFPGNPETCKQRLIYAGKLLQNDHQIKNILKENNEIVHLAYYNNEPITETDNKPSCSKTLPKTRPEPNQPELRQRVQSNGTHGPNTQAQNHYYPPNWACPQTTMNPYMSQVAYMQWLQYQRYAQYYGYMGYMNYQQPPQAVNPAPETDNTPPGAQDQPAGANENARVEGQAGGRADDDDEFNRDWLDAAFGFVRLCMMLSIVYFYSSTYRFLITVGVFLVIYLYQAGAFQVNRRPRVPAPQENAADEQQETDDNNNQSDGAVSDESVEADAPPATPPPPGVLITAWHFVRSFFSSLLPTGPPGMAN